MSNISSTSLIYKVSIEGPNEYLDSLIEPSFQGVNRLFALSFENNAHRTRHTGHFPPKVEIKDYYDRSRR